MSEEGIQVNSPRRSARLKDKPVTIPVECHEEEEKVENFKQKKKRMKTAPADDVDDDIEIVTEKVAPVFLQFKKLEAEKAMKKAKQEFLQSSIPEALKQQVALQSALEQREVEIFPRVSHVTQVDPQNFLSSYPALLSSWLKPALDVCIPKTKIFNSDLNQTTKLSSITSDEKTDICKDQNLEWSQCKEWIRHFKEDRLINFPFLRTLWELLPKGLTSEEHQWNDVCGTKHWNDNLANNSAIHQLKQWLKQWKLKAGDVVEASLKKKKAKRKRIDSDASELDAELIDQRSSSPEWSDPELLCNTMLIAGPAGCGKTASIYALAEQLGFNVLEVNASSRRNGKSVLSQLHEATQSHTVSNSSGGSNMSKFFRPATAAPKLNEQRTALSLVLFEDVDVVFETEDESFYSALSTLMINSKRPIILTLTCSDESSITLVTDKIKSQFETLHYKSPDLTSLCSLMWTWLLAEGYPLQWDNLQNYTKSLCPWTGDLDLRRLLLDLQFRLFHHPLRMKLNFNQSDLSNHDATISSVPDSSEHKKSNEIRFIDLPCHSTIGEWPVLPLDKLPRFTYTEEEGFACKISPEAQPDRVEHCDEKKPVPATGDLNNLIHCLDFRAFSDVCASFRAKSYHLSLNDSNHLEDMEQFIMSRCSHLWMSELEHHNITDAIQPRQHRAATDVLLEEYLPRRIILNRSASSNDILPYTRSICRSDLVHSTGKRRRSTNPKQAFTFRLPISDVTLSSSVVLDLVNSL